MAWRALALVAVALGCNWLWFEALNVVKQKILVYHYQAVNGHTLGRDVKAAMNIKNKADRFSPEREIQGPGAA